jgi:hypothetical protein
MNETLVVRVRLLLEPVTVTVYEPVIPEHERFDVPAIVRPLRETLVGDRAQVSPEDGAIVAANETVPVNP